MASTDSNPIRAPEEHEPVPDESHIRDRWLILLSFYAALLLEVVPLEADVLFAYALHPKDLVSFAVIKLLFLSVILGPLALFVCLNGLTGLKSYPGRTITIGIVVGLNLAMNFMVIARMLG